MRVLGFPVQVRRGFLFFMLLVVFLNPGDFGVWLAASIAGFTLVHELGHAVAARRAGASAEISLDFLAGYASYTSPRPLSRGTEALIALAGPVTHITAGLAVLAVMGVNPLDAVSRGSTDAARAVWWAGPVIGAFNLLPVLPLDGGNVVTSVLDRALPGRARSVMVYVSVVLTAIGAVVLALTAYRGFDVLPRDPVADAAPAALRTAPAQRRVAVRRGVGGVARRQRGAGQADHGQGPDPAWRRRRRPETLDEAELRALLRLLPRPIPHGDSWNEYVLTNLLVRAGSPREAAEYGADSYGRNAQPLLAATIARAAGAVGDEETAVAWLRAAAGDGTATESLASVIDQASELAAVRRRPDVIALREALQPTR